MRDAAHQRAPQGPEATAAYHYKARAKLLGQPHDLCIGPPEPRVRLRYLAAVLPYPPDLLVEPRLGLFPGALLHPASEIRVERPRARGLVVDERYVPHIDDVQLRACSLGQLRGRGGGQLRLPGAVGG